MAAFFWIHAGANSNWATNGNWSATSGGGSNAAQPTTTSDVTFDGAGTHGNEASIVSASITILSLTFTTGFTSSVTINTAVVLTIGGAFTDRTQHSWTVSGTGSMTISAASTITSNGQTFPGPVSFSGSNTKTLVGNWTISGTLTCATNTTTINKTTAEVLSCGGWTVTGITAGSINITLTGGTWSGTNTNTVSGTITLSSGVTISGVVHISGCTLVGSSGVTTTSSTLTIDGSSTLNTSPVSFATVTIPGSITLTLSSLLTATTLNFTNASFTVTFAGTSGFSVGTWSCTNTAASTVNMVNTVTYTVTTAFTASTSRTGAIVTFTSDHATNLAILTLNNGASCTVLASFTRIDASAGRAIWTFNGTITTCNNIFSLTDAFPPAQIISVRAGATY